MIEKYFIPLDRAKKLNDLGFSEECIGYYKDSDMLKAVDQHGGMALQGICKELGYNVDDLILAPTYEQAFSFFRDKYKIDSNVSLAFYQYGSKNYEYYEQKYYIYKIFKNPSKLKSKKYKNYEEARLACLDKLIEILYNDRNNKTIKNRKTRLSKTI